MKTDTIAAIATAMTNSGIGIIRISGEDAFTVIDRIYQSKNGKKKLSEEKSHTVHYGYIVDDTKENKIIDEVMVLIMRAPNTYTREDTVEIDCHGGVLVMQKILDTVVCHGARPAEPGEFTKRAFLNGRIDLTQAESVMDPSFRVLCKKRSKSCGKRSFMRLLLLNLLWMIRNISILMGMGRN